MKILMPAGLKIDQVIALAVVLEACKRTIDEVQFFFLDLDADAIPEDAFDLDARVKYPRGSSATEEVAKKYSIAGLDALTQELAANNATGFMRQGDNSFARLAQKLYGLHASTVSERDHRIEVLKHFVKVGQTYLRTVRDGRLGAKTMSELAGKADSSKRIHHLSGYIARLVEEGKEQATVVAELKWWWTKFAAAERAEQRAKERIEGIDNLPIYNVAGMLKVAVMRAKADEITKAVFARYPRLDVLVTIQPDRVAILPNYKNGLGHRMRELYEALERLEPGAWHYEQRGNTGLIMNGSARRHAPIATVIGRDAQRLLTLMVKAWNVRVQVR